MSSNKVLPGNLFRFKANPRWKDVQVVRTVAQIVQGTRVFFRQKSGYRWMLGRSNDWWMDKDPQTGEFILAWRYGGGGNTVHMQLLYHVILQRLLIEHFNEEAKAGMSREERLEWLRRYFEFCLAERPHGPGAPTQFDRDVFEALKGLEKKYAKE